MQLDGAHHQQGPEIDARVLVIRLTPLQRGVRGTAGGDRSVSQHVAENRLCASPERILPTTARTHLPGERGMQGRQLDANVSHRASRNNKLAQTIAYECVAWHAGCKRVLAISIGI